VEELTTTVAARDHALVAEQYARARTEEALGAAVTLANERLRKIEELNQAFNVVLNSTVWRASRPLRSFIAQRPAIRALARKMRSTAGRLVRQWRGQAGPKVRTQTSAPTPVVSAERDAVRPYFDAPYYRATNQEVLADPADPLDHFMREGWRQGRNPSAGFDLSYYLSSNPDVAAAGLNPLLHYAWVGRSEGRLPRRPMDAFRQSLDAAQSPRVRAADWAGGADRSQPLSGPALLTILTGRQSAEKMVIAVSHDDYAANFGGVQNLIADVSLTHDVTDAGST
jgi:hypothetical protein